MVYPKDNLREWIFSSLLSMLLEFYILCQTYFDTMTPQNYFISTYFWYIFLILFSSGLKVNVTLQKNFAVTILDYYAIIPPQKKDYLFFCKHKIMQPNIFQVLQKQMDLELELFGDLKDKSGNSSALGKVYMLSLSSQPVDHEDASGERQKVSNQLLY